MVVKTANLNLVSVFRKLERSGDHITNIAEEIVFFIDADNSKKKLLFYIIAAVLVVINLFVVGYKLQVWWMYMPMIGLGAIVVAQPSMYCTPFFYESFGTNTAVASS